MSRTHLLVAAAIALGLTASGPATAQSYPARSYPDRPIRLIVPFPPGGPTDYVARLVAQHVSANLGQIVLDNRPGAGGTIASKAVANADPDGYTLLYGSSATLGIAPALYKNVEYDAIKSFAPVALVSRVPFVLGVAAAVPANTLSEFIAYAKANPGKLNFGATIGTPPHLVGELFKVTTGADIYYIRYKGAAQTMIENGYSGFQSTSWTGVLAPAGTPASIVSKLNTAVNDALQSPEISTNFARFSAQA